MKYVQCGWLSNRCSLLFALQSYAFFARFSNLYFAVAIDVVLLTLFKQSLFRNFEKL